jgi:hypothetical protein
VSRSNFTCAEKPSGRNEAVGVEEPLDFSCSAIFEPGDVFDEEDRGVNFVDDSRDVVPDPPVVFLLRPLPVSAVAPGLAGEADRDEIHFSTPRAAVEGREIVPDRSRIQDLLFHPRHERGRACGVPLTVSHTSVSVSECELKSEFESANPGTKSHPI